MSALVSGIRVGRAGDGGFFTALMGGRGVSCGRAWTGGGGGVGGRAEGAGGVEQDGYQEARVGAPAPRTISYPC